MGTVKTKVASDKANEQEVEERRRREVFFKGALADAVVAGYLPDVRGILGRYATLLNVELRDDMTALQLSVAFRRHDITAWLLD